jgi:predicted phosphodiesterase
MIAIISDIHGNFTALKKVLEKIDSMGISEIFCLGDTVGYYSEINECCNELISRNIKSVMGNHDWYMVAGSFCPRSKSVNDCLEYQQKIITKNNLEWLASLPSFIRFNDLFMTHGGWTNPIDEYIIDPNEEYFYKISGKFFASGHTHRQVIKDFNTKIYCNPGSVGQPRDNDPRAAFATFDGKNFFAHRVEYDFNKVCSLMNDAGFSGYYYNCLKNGSPRLG